MHPYSLTFKGYVGQWDKYFPRLAYENLSKHTLTMKRRNTVTHAAQVIGALRALQSGDAPSKTAAAAQAGISTNALKPQQLANTSRNPLLRSLARSDPLDITADVDGKRVSMREALSKGAESSVETLGRLSQRNGKLTPAEERQVRQCRQWLDLCKMMGLFRDDSGPALPGELQGLMQDDEHGPDEGSVEWYMLHANTHAQPAGLLRVTPIPPETERVAQTGKVDDKPFQAQDGGSQAIGDPKGSPAV